MNKDTPLAKALTFVRAKDMAEACNVSSQSITNWQNRGVPPKYCMKIQSLTSGRVTAHQLRPDIFTEESKK